MDAASTIRLVPRQARDSLMAGQRMKVSIKSSRIKSNGALSKRPQGVHRRALFPDSSLDKLGTRSWQARG